MQVAMAELATVVLLFCLPRRQIEYVTVTECLGCYAFGSPTRHRAHRNGHLIQMFPKRVARSTCAAIDFYHL